MATYSSDTGRLSPPALAARSAQTLNSRREPAKPPLQGHCRLVMDATGVGAPVVDLLRQAELRPVAVSITGGDKVTSGKGSLYVPKRDLVDAPQVMFQSGRLKVAEGLAEAELLVQELLNAVEVVVELHNQPAFCTGTFRCFPVHECTLPKSPRSPLR